MDIADWQDQAKCVGQIELFYDPKTIFKAKKVCGDCPVKEPCLEYALEHMGGPDDGDFLVWGGTTIKERVRIRNAREAMPRRVKVHSDIVHGRDGLRFRTLPQAS